MSLARQTVVFLVVGGIQLLLDCTIYVAATHWGMPVAWANLLGRVCAACLGFWLHGRYTFADAGRSRATGQALARFVMAWLAITAVSTVTMSALAAHVALAWTWLAKPAVELLLAVVSFLVWRHWVYRD